jgi:hypothetical protein
MAIVDRSCTLPANADAVWAAVQTPGAFKLVTRGLLSMPALRGRTDPWEQGETVVGWIFLFGVIPLSRHHLLVASLDEEHRTLRSSEHGGLLRRWDHDITVEPIDDRSCRYRDRIEIDAGALTPIVAAWARWFYRMRQRRWIQLAAALRAMPVGPAPYSRAMLANLV